MKPPVSGILNPLGCTHLEIAISRQGHVEWVACVLHVPLVRGARLMRSQCPITKDKILLEPRCRGIGQIVGNRVVVELLNETSSNRIVDTDVQNLSPLPFVLFPEGLQWQCQYSLDNENIENGVVTIQDGLSQEQEEIAYYIRYQLVSNYSLELPASVATGRKLGGRERPLESRAVGGEKSA